MAYSSIPRISASYEDGFFDTVSASLQPKVLVLGTASDGRTDTLWRVGSVSAAVKEFKNNGTLTRGMYEVIQQGSDNIHLRRLATGTSGVLTGICSDEVDGGITITTVQEDDDVGDRYALWFDATTGRIAIYDNEDEEWIYDSEEELAIDTGLISVSGSCTVGDGVSVGTQSAPVNFEDAPDENPGIIVWTNGTDGTTPSLMELYEALDAAYEDLDWVDVDLIVPMGVYLDATNTADLTEAEITALALGDLADYPTAGADDDVLGLVYREEYQGIFYYWWDMDGDGVAEIFPTTGSASATTTINGDDLAASDFHEVNFAYQAAEFCRKASTTWHTCIAFVGVKAPDSFSRADLSTWIGDLPEYTEMDDGSEVVNSSGDNGTGLAGNKFLAGRADFRSGSKGGGFIATDTGYLDGIEEEDNNEHVVDIGKHLVVAFPWVIHLNNWVNPSSTPARPAPYIGSIITAVAGKYATLPEKEEANGPNGALRGIRLVGTMPGRLLNKLLSVRYVGARVEPGIGVILAGSKTTARTDSDWTKISTIRSANRELQGIRSIGMKYIGKEFSSNILLALQTAVDGFLKEEKTNGYNNGAKATITYTAAQRRLGQLSILLKMVPPFAIEVIDVEMSLTDDESDL